MNKTKALALVQQQRRFWHSQEPDAAIARRAERVFFRMALVYFICATLLFAVGSTPRHHALAFGSRISGLWCGLVLAGPPIHPGVPPVIRCKARRESSRVVTYFTTTNTHTHVHTWIYRHLGHIPRRYRP